MPPPAGRPSAVVADSDGLSRAALAEVLVADAGVRVVAEATDPVAAVDAVARHRPDLLLVDRHLGGVDVGLTVVRRVVSGSSSCRVLVLAEEEDGAALASLMRAGASGYVPRTGRLAELVRTVHAALRGETCIPRRVFGDLLTTLLEQRAAEAALDDRIAKLSARERQVLRLLAQGCDNRAVAAALVISPETARTHVQNVLSKLGVHSRVAAATLAVERGLMEMDGGGAA